MAGRDQGDQLGDFPGCSVPVEEMSKSKTPPLHSALQAPHPRAGGFILREGELLSSYKGVLCFPSPEQRAATTHINVHFSNS